MRSGDKNALVTISNYVETTDPEYNTANYTKTLWKDGVFCRATPRRGRETEVDGQVVANTYMKFDFDYLDVDGINETMVITHEGLDYGITAVLKDLNGKDFISVDTIYRPTPTERS